MLASYCNNKHQPLIGQHEGLLHQLRLMETELERAEADKEELQAQLR